MSRKLLQILIGAAFAIALIASQETRALAITTGTVDGTVSDQQSGAVIAGVTITAISPSGTYHTTTDAKGYYVVEGLSPDTYSIEAHKTGYEVSIANGVTVVQGATQVVNLKLTTSLKSLGRVTVRSTAGLVQPSQPVDSYSVGVAQVEQLGGTPMNDNEAVLIEELPGVSATGGSGSAGGLQGYYPLIRGGLENNEGFQLEGIWGLEPISNQFINNLILDGQKSLNVVAGPGDATQGGAGSGYVNIVTKTGTYPQSGAMGAEIGSPAFGHNFKFEYGTATPDNRISFFLSGRYDRNYGGCCAPPFSNTWGNFNTTQPDTAGQLAFVVTNDTVMNTFFKFGRDNRNTIQLWNEWGSNRFIGDNGIDPSRFPFPSNDLAVKNLYGLFGLPPTQIPFYNAPQFNGDTGPGVNWQTSQNQVIANPAYQNGDFVLTKLGFSRQLSDRTFAKLAAYQTQNSIPFGGLDTENPYLGYGFAFGFLGDFWEYDHTKNTGFTLDLQNSLSDHHLLSVGGEYRQSSVFQDISLASAQIVFLGGFSGGAQWCEWTNVCGFNGVLTNGGTTFPRMPDFDTRVTDPEYFRAAYIQDQWKPNSRITFQPGVRYEGQLIPTAGGRYDVSAWSPRVSGTYSLDPDQRTVLRATFGHATIFAPLFQVETLYNPPASFRGIKLPAGDPNLMTCGGPPFVSACADLFDMVYNSYWHFFGINPFAFPKPQASDTYDLSFEHEFPHNITMKITGYTRRDYNVIVRQALPLALPGGGGGVVTGPESTTNAGVGRTTGVEFALSRQVSEGLSTQLNVTYINQFINYFGFAAFNPTVNPAILNTGTIAHPNYLSPVNATLTLDYRHSGWRVDPIWNFYYGYPIGVWQNVPINVSPTGNPNGPFAVVPSTNTNGGFGGNYCYYTDPQIPGTIQNPNVVGSIGGGCTKSLNGNLTKRVVFLNFVVSKDIGKNMNVGFDIWNTFGNVSNYPYFGGNPFGTNSYVNNGFGAFGPGSGVSQFFGPNAFFRNVAAPASFPQTPFFNIPSGPGRQWQFFVTQKF